VQGSCWFSRLRALALRRLLGVTSDRLGGRSRVGRIQLTLHPPFRRFLQPPQHTHHSEGKRAALARRRRAQRTYSRLCTPPVGGAGLVV
jgi:hypothetical protein